VANSHLLEGIRCPKCLETERFAIQMTINVFVVDDGLDIMASQPAEDHFPGRVIDPNDGFFDEDPISCANRNGCGYTGTVAEFRVEQPALIAA